MFVSLRLLKISSTEQSNTSPHCIPTEEQPCRNTCTMWRCMAGHEPSRHVNTCLFVNSVRVIGHNCPLPLSQPSRAACCGLSGARLTTNRIHPSSFHPNAVASRNSCIPQDGALVENVGIVRTGFKAATCCLWGSTKAAKWQRVTMPSSISGPPGCTSGHRAWATSCSAVVTSDCPVSLADHRPGEKVRYC